MSIINNTKCFDRRDNTFLLSNRSIASKLHISASTVDRLFRTLSKHRLVKMVTNQLLTKDKVTMLSPKFIFISYNNSDRWIIGALWELEDLSKVYQWRDLCEDLTCFIDPVTGEVKTFNWYEITLKANQYTAFDRCYRNKSKCVYNSDCANDNSSQHYNIEELNTNKLLLDDIQWFNNINSFSDHNYATLDFSSFKPRQPINIYSIKI